MSQGFGSQLNIGYLHKVVLCGHFFFFFFFNKFIYWLHWVSIAARGLSLVTVSGGYSLLWCAGFSLQWLLLLLWSTGSRHAGFGSCGSWALERRLSSCGTRAQLLRGIWDLPGPGLEPGFPALAGEFLTTTPPGKSLWSLLKRFLFHFVSLYFDIRRASFLGAGKLSLLY